MCNNIMMVFFVLSVRVHRPMRIVKVQLELYSTPVLAVLATPAIDGHDQLRFVRRELARLLTPENAFDNHR